MSTTTSVRKVLTANDLGLTGAHQAGIAIPKEPAILDFFPPLNPSDYNPDFLMDVRTESGELWQLRFIYYNNKLHGIGTRNEYRLTGTTRMLRSLGAALGDTVVFTRRQFGDIEVGIEKPRPPETSDQGVTILKNGWRLTISDV